MNRRAAWAGLAAALAGAAVGALLCLATASAQTASLLPNGQQQFADANGAPYASGLVYFYAPFSTTPKATWQDPNQSTLNSNPVVLDGSGRTVVYGSGQYRQVLKDQFGNTIWDQLTAGQAGTVAAGTTGQAAYYASNGNTVSPDSQAIFSLGSLSLGTIGTGSGSLTLNAATSGAVTVSPQSSTATYTFLLPSATPLAGSQLASSAGGSSALVWKTQPLAVQVFTSTGTYTPTTGISGALIHCLGAGGGGGGVTGAIGGNAGAGGGGAGSQSETYAIASTIGASQVVTIGTAGAGGGSATTGASGGDTSVGSLCIGKGGTGGTGQNTAGGADGGNGGVAGTGTVTGTGAPGGIGIGPAISQAGFPSGSGGSSAWGGAGRGGITANGAVGGLNASGFGAGGGGAEANNSTSSANGGNASPGLVWIEEY